MEIQYPKSHIHRIAALHSLIALLGLALFAWPFVTHTFPGSGDATNHVTLGTLIAVAAIFRAFLGYGSFWLDIPVFAMGLIALGLPHFTHMQWNHPYQVAHHAAGIAICLLSTLAAALTIPLVRSPAFKR
jgi:hypothetical protein